MATFEIKDTKNQIIIYQGKEYKVDVEYTGRTYWVFDAVTGEKLVKWDYHKYKLYTVRISDVGRFKAQSFLDKSKALAVYNNYLDYYRKVAEIKQSGFKVEIEINEKNNENIFGEEHEDCYINITTPMYDRVICLGYSQFYVPNK